MIALRRSLGGRIIRIPTKLVEVASRVHWHSVPLLARATCLAGQPRSGGMVRIREPAGGHSQRTDVPDSLVETEVTQSARGGVLVSQRSHSWPQKSHSRTEVSHSRPQRSHKRPEVFHSRPQRSHNRTEVFHRRPDVFHSRPEVFHSRPQRSHRRTEVFHSRSEVAQSARGVPQSATEVTQSARGQTELRDALRHAPVSWKQS